MAVGHRQSRGGLNVSIAGGLVGGAVAYVLTFLVFFVLKAGQIQQNFEWTGGQFAQIASQVNFPAKWQAAGWIFYSAHNVDIVMDVSAMGQSMSRTMPLKQGTLWESWFIVLPIVVLLVAGAVVAALAGSWNGLSGFQAGGSVVLGYGILSLAGLFLTKWTFSFSQMGSEVSGSMGPGLLTGILLAVIVYPVVIGGVGGAIGGALNR